MTQSVLYRVKVQSTPYGNQSCIRTFLIKYLSGRKSDYTVLLYCTVPDRNFIKLHAFKCTVPRTWQGTVGTVRR